MTFQGFSKQDFKAMQTPGLNERMQLIEKYIQPKFNQLGQSLTAFLCAKLGNEMFLHIARHARRSVNPPDSTWLAIANSKRGYKKHPHFQVGLYENYLFVWLAFIYENEDRARIASHFLKKKKNFANLPADFVISKDHTVPTTYLLNEEKLTEALERFRDVKKGEFLIGKIYEANDPLLTDGQALVKDIEKVFEQLLPFYQLAYK